MDVTDLYLKGTKLEMSSVRKLEKRLLSNPDDVEKRIMLLGFYARNRFNRENNNKAYIRHVLWMIQYQPTSEAIGKPFCKLHPMDGGRAWNRARRLFEKHLAQNPQDISILRSAANFYVWGDPKSSKNYFRKLIKLEPKNPEWRSRLGHLYELDLIRLKENRKSYRTIALKALILREQAYALSNRKEEKFYLLDDLGLLAFKAGLNRKATRYAQRLLKMAAQFKKNWSYGNAIESAHSTLGLVALQQNKMSLAKKHLSASTRHKGSPQLNSFGPDFDLAKAMLVAGEKKAVISHLQKCERFWSRKRELLERWIAEIKGTGTTSFQKY